jgi:putative glutamine amidotransferase
MIRRSFLAVLIAGLLGLAGSLRAQAPDRFLDLPRPAGDGVRLVLFNPTTYNIRCLAEVRKLGYLEVPGLTVIGIYHVKQRDDFQASKRFVQDNALDWFKFHAVSAEINQPELFRANACTPEFEAIVHRADGLILVGGPDIPSTVFARKTHLLAEVTDPFRHYLEVSAVFHLLGGDIGRPALLASRPGFPILGICLGFQTLNVGTGGTLIQDIPTERYARFYVEDVIAQGQEQWHNNPYRALFPLDKLMPYNFHTVTLKPKARITRAMGFGVADHPRVLSSHHQALGMLGRGWIATATSRDGKVVEAIEHRRYRNVLGVQFHPEHYLLWDAEARFRQKPGDPLTSYHALLAGTPRSLEFNQAIWRWFGARLTENSGR